VPSASSLAFVADRDDRRLVNLMGALSLALTDRIAAVADTASGLSDAAPAALVALHETGRPGRSIAELRQLVGLTHSGAVRLVDRLEAAGYVARRPGPDARTVAVVLTRRGTAAANRIRAARQEAVSAALENLDETQRRRLEELAGVLLSRLTAQRLALRASGQMPPAGAMCRLCDFVACGRPAGRCPVAGTAIEAAGRGPGWGT
jgi:MarR family transcriptional regulator, negative regulator of the multidrug operon emrRAB